jgi:hypothetical protein
MIDKRLRRLLGVEITRHKELTRFEVVVDRPHYLEQLLPALGVVQEIGGSNTIERADFS